MARPRTAMREIREVLRLAHAGGLSERQVAASVRIAPSTVHRYLDRAARAGLGWPLPDGLDDAALERALFPPAPPSSVPRTAPDYGWIHRELRRKGVTLQLLWMEYRQAHPDGYGYSQFCARCQQWAGRVDLVMRHQHRGRGQAVRRLRRAHDPDLPTGRAVVAGAAVRGGAGGQQLHLRRSVRLPTAGVLDRRARALLRVLRRPPRRCWCPTTCGRA
jgi:hypothetical protein